MAKDVRIMVPKPTKPPPIFIVVENLKIMVDEVESVIDNDDLTLPKHEWFFNKVKC